MVKRQVPFFNYRALFEAQEQELTAKVVDVMRRGAYILQQDLADFERQLREFLGVKHAFGVADGTNALIIALQAAGLGRGDEVIVPSHTYVASAASIHLAGATPVLVECRDDHMIDPAGVRSAITGRTRAIMPVQLNGRTADMDEIMAIAHEHGLRVIEDAAQALGSRFRGRFAGTFGAAGTFSFYPAKLLGCFGDGGGVVTNDDAMGERLALLRDHGRDSRGEVVAWGTNSRLDNLQAAILNVKFRTFTADLDRRRRLAALYDEGLRDIPELLLPPAPGADPRHHDVYQNYEIEAERRDELKKHLEECGVRTIVQFGGKAVHQFEGLGLTHYRLPRTELLYRRALLLPMNTSLSDEDVRYVVGCVRGFYGRG
ncbi:MAG: DegT/DnrJ/EryC1/StrS family aminotransferase [Gammaproteobacteria bacterium]|nr:DegT/DnrJ/EryC1/StrS family aminotransferase [Gammaproteobacteria bacterium]